MSDPMNTKRPRAPAAWRRRNPGRSVLVVLLLALSVALLIVVGAAAFTDVPGGHPYGPAIQTLSDRGIITGFPDNTFRPESLVIRQQFAKMIVLTLGLPVSESDVVPFSDVPVGGFPDPFYPDNYIAVAAEAGITVGTGPNTFSPGANILRAQVVTMIVRAAQNLLPPGTLATPPAGYTGSVPAFSDIHSPNLRVAEYNGLLAGLQGFAPSWDPWAPASRGEVAQMLANLLGKMTPATTTTTTASTTTTTGSTTTTAPTTTTTTATTTTTTTTTPPTTTTTSSTTTSSTTTSSTTTTTTVPGAGWENLGGVITSGPAVASWGPGRLDVFARGGDGALWHKYFQGIWSGWESLGGYIQAGSDPAAVSWGPGRIDVFVRGGDDALYHKFFSNGVWSAYDSHGGFISTSPAATSRGSNRLDVFARGSLGELVHTWWDGSNWHGWETLGYSIDAGSSPAATTLDWEGSFTTYHDIYVYYRGTNLRLWQSSWDDLLDGWFGPQNLGGILTSSPGVSSWQPNRIDVFVRATDGTLYTYTSGAWTSLGGAPFVGDPDAVSWAPNRIDVFGRGTDNALWHKWWNGSFWEP